MQRELPIANGSFLVAQSPSGQLSFVATRSVPIAELGCPEIAARKRTFNVSIVQTVSSTALMQRALVSESRRQHSDTANS